MNILYLNFWQKKIYVFLEEFCSCPWLLVVKNGSTNTGTSPQLSTGKMFLGPYQPLHRVLKYFLYLSCVQGSSIFRGILTMTKTLPRPLELQDVLVLTFWVVPVPIWIFAYSTILSGCTCCDVDITMATDALKCTSFQVDIDPTSHWSSSLSPTAAYKKAVKS